MSTTLPVGQSADPSPQRVPAAAGTRAVARERLVSLDVFRGLTIAGMLLVNDPGSWGAIYPPLEHAAWNGWTPTDLIFPFFIFIVGITTHLSLTARRARGDDEHAIRQQIYRRGALIFLFGLLLNGFPFFTWGQVAGVADPTFLQRVVDRLYHWRIMGVLQRIGIAYLLAALLTQGKSTRRIIATATALLIAYWFVMTALPVPDSGALGYTVLGEPSRTMAAYWDRFFLDWSRFGLGNHIWAQSITWDPEGLLSTIPAIATGMLGVVAGRWIGTQRSLSERLNGLFAFGAIFMVAGLVWNWWFPINKSLWTSSYVLFTAGLAAVTVGTVMWIVDVQGVKRFTQPFVIYGMNPIVAFVGSGLMARVIYSIIMLDYNGQPTPLVTVIYREGLASWLSPRSASLAFALCFVAFWFGILYVLHRKRIFLKV